MIVSLLKWEESFEKALNVLSRGGLIIYPTDTAYGLGGDATSDDVVKKIYSIKERSKDKPISVMVSSFSMLEEWFYIDDYIDLLSKYLPGPYTFILKAKKRLAVGDKVGVRIPSSFFARELVRRFGKPITATSANISGRATPYRVEELDEIKERVDLIVDGGECSFRGVSTVVDLLDRKIVREGVGQFEW